MYLMIDHYDSFVYNLCVYMRELGEEVLVIRHDRAARETVGSLMESACLSGIILSPGPGTPDSCAASCRIVKEFAGRIPILGVCLGHQVIGRVFGGMVKKGQKPMHGKISAVKNNGRGLFAGLPATYQVTRYHSLVVERESLPETLRIDAWTEDGVIMAISHRTKPVYGVQFHPEALLTEYGHELMGNFVRICEDWKKGEDAHDIQNDGQTAGTLQAHRRAV